MPRVNWEAREITHFEANPAEVPQRSHKRRHGGGVVERKSGAATHFETSLLGTVHVTPNWFSLGERKHQNFQMLQHLVHP